MKSFIFTLIAIFSTQTFAFDQSHKKWNDILQAYTKFKGKQVLVDYKTIKMNRSKLDSYLSDLEKVTTEQFKKFSKDEQLSFWINAYNAYTVKWIIKHYPVKSIKKTVGFFGNPWKKKFVTLLGNKMSLDGIEHETIRKQFKEARIHFAVNCASIGCPSLYREAFVGVKLESQLEAATKHFMGNKEKNYIKGNTYYLSKIFTWYGEDFEKYHGSVRNFVQKYMGQLKTKNVELDDLSYDWDLNDY